MSDLEEFREECPDLASIFKGKKYLVHVKIGGESQIIDVVALGSPYKADFGKGRQAHYVDVFGYGWSGSVLASKLREVVMVKENRWRHADKGRGENKTVPLRNIDSRRCS